MNDYDSRREDQGERRARAWSAMVGFSAKLSEKKPSKGKRVLVVEGRKHKGKIGVVFWHGRDQYAGRQYGDSFQKAASDATGKWGFRVGVKTDTGEKFFIGAERVQIVTVKGGVA